jgi:DNA-binding transcriptional regulator YdaS (Cro superfamily)
MTLAEYLLIEDADRLAKACGTQAVYLMQIIRGVRRPSPKLARRIHAATNGVVTLESLRPDIWGELPKK